MPLQPFKHDTVTVTVLAWRHCLTSIDALNQHCCADHAHLFLQNVLIAIGSVFTALRVAHSTQLAAPNKVRLRGA
jgi:hypothetical protein